ncbi:MAG: hypothetical protein CO093_07740 [Alphaproteobacteria bacterium CG_4_9_14_3_um_filter_47_13]|nr:MAG: hypothetical protein CO093_07740 [Alphaproteobacteria bacterium CG_4_9_14_3_um_filter_47_13]
MMKAKVQSNVNGIVLPPAIKALLREDEKIIRVATIHWGIYWKTVAFGLLTLYLLLSPFFLHLGIFFALIVVIMFSLAVLYKQFLILVLTDKRVFLRHGIIRVDTIQIRHSRIESVETEKTIMGQILGYAVVVIYGTGSRRTAIPFIADALEFRNELDEMLNEYEEKVIGKDDD